MRGPIFSLPFAWAFVLIVAPIGLAIAADLDLDIQDASEIEKALTVTRTRGFEVVAIDETAPIQGKIDLKLEFEFDSQRLTATARVQLDQLAIAIQSEALEAASIEVIGHTDGKGSAEYNRLLSLRRAEAVKDYLEKTRGVSSGRLLPIGRGEEQLLVPNEPASRKNRRVEFKNVQRVN